MQKTIKKVVFIFLLVLLIITPIKSFAFPVSTSNASFITTVGAQLNGGMAGVFSSNGFVSGWFRYSQDATSSCSGMTNSSSTFGQTSVVATGVGSSYVLSATITGLNPNTTYYFCAVGSNNTGTFYGNVVSFITLPLPSGSGGGTTNNSGTIGTVTTYPAFNITDGEASFRGNVSSTTGTSYGYFRFTATNVPPVFCNDIYGSDMISVTSTIPNTNGQVTSGSFYASVENLEPDTQYYYCAIVSNSSTSATQKWVTPNIKYGSVKTFRTLPCDTCPHTTITTEPATNVKSTSAKLRGSYTSTKTVTTYFQYKKASNLANPGSSIDPDGTVTNNTTQSGWISVGSTQHNVNASTNFNSVYGGLSYNLSGLIPDTVYNFRLVGTTSNPSETIYGNTINFVTHKFEGVGPTSNSGGTQGGGGTTGGGGNSSSVCPTGYTGTPPNCVNSNTSTPLPYVNVVANPPTITVTGGTSTISWTSANVTSCATDVSAGGGVGGGGPSGSFGTGPITSGRSYSVTCTGPNGSVSDSVYVYVNTGGGSGGTGGGGGGGTTNNSIPSVSMTASPVVVAPGGSSTISWSSTIHLLDSCVVSGYPGLSNSQNTGLSGSFSTGALNTDHSYSVSCTGPNGSVSDSVYVYVNTGGTNPNNPNGSLLPMVSVTGSPLVVAVEGIANISWTSQNVTSCNTGISGTSSGASGSFSTSALTTSHSYSVTCTGPNGSASDSVYILVNQITDDGGDDWNPGDDSVTPPTTGTCPVGWTGTPATGCINPNTTNGNNTCPVGWTGTPTTGCINPDANSCPTGWNGTPATGCINPNTTTGTTCPSGWTGTPTTGCIAPNYWPACGIGTADLDCDGIINFFDTDIDGDGWPNNVDLDDDGDGIPDILDPFPSGNGSNYDYDGGGIPNNYDSDLDGDGVPNVIDTDTDGDGWPNNTDFDDDGDGVPDLLDPTPTGTGTVYDYDGGGVPNNNDSDIDGDGVPNESDPDTDGDGVPNNLDQDDDNDGVPDGTDTTPTGATSSAGPILNIGDTAFPLFDDIVRYHEGIEHVFIRRIMKSAIFQNKYGYQPGSNLQIFAWNLAHLFAKDFGYVNNLGREIRVSKPDVSAYSLRLSGNKLTVYEYYKNVIIDIRNTTNQFKTKNPYEYYFKKN